MRALLAALVLLLACSQTHADGRSWGHGPSFHGNGYGHPHGNWGRPGWHQGPDVSGGIIGGMIGSWLWNQFNQPPPPPPPPPEQYR